MQCFMFIKIMKPFNQLYMYTHILFFLKPLLNFYSSKYEFDIKVQNGRNYLVTRFCLSKADNIW